MASLVMRFPADETIARVAQTLKIPIDVVIRDLVRMFEVVNMRDKGFFAQDSVLAGGMAMRCYDSNRITVYDADFSTERRDTPKQLQEILTCSTPDLDIAPSDVTPGKSDGMWQSRPVDFDPHFTTIQLTERQKTFKVDVSWRGVMQDGRELRLRNPYVAFDLWDEAPSVHVMRLEEIAAEKMLGWCAHGRYKHYVDLAFIGIAYGSKGSIDRALLRQLAVDKLAVMSNLQPHHYEGLSTLEHLVARLTPPVKIAVDQVDDIRFLSHPWRPDEVQFLVRDHFLPLLRT